MLRINRRKIRSGRKIQRPIEINAEAEPGVSLFQCADQLHPLIRAEAVYDCLKHSRTVMRFAEQLRHLHDFLHFSRRNHALPGTLRQRLHAFSECIQILLHCRIVGFHICELIQINNCILDSPQLLRLKKHVILRGDLLGIERVDLSDRFAEEGKLRIIPQLVPDRCGID